MRWLHLCLIHISSAQVGDCHPSLVNAPLNLQACYPGMQQSAWQTPPQQTFASLPQIRVTFLKFCYVFYEKNTVLLDLILILELGIFMICLWCPLVKLSIKFPYCVCSRKLKREHYIRELRSAIDKKFRGYPPKIFFLTFLGEKSFIAAAAVVAHL